MTTRSQAANAAIEADIAATGHFDDAAQATAAPTLVENAITLSLKQRRFDREHDLALAAVGEQAKAEAVRYAEVRQEALKRVKDLDAHVADMTPEHRARSGYVSALIAAGGHEPAGSTIANGAGPVFEAVGRDSSKRRDSRDKGQEFIGDHKSYVTLMGGNIGAVKEVLSDFAARNAVETLIEAQKPLSNGKTQFGLSTLLDRSTVADIGALGAEYTGSFKTLTAPRVVAAAEAKAKAAEAAAGVQPSPAAM